MKDLQGRILLHGLRVQAYQRLVQISILHEKKTVEIVYQGVAAHRGERLRERGKLCNCPSCVGWHALQRVNIENSKQKFPVKELRGLRSKFHIHLSVSDLYIHRISLPILAAGKYLDQFWEYINRSQTHECGNWD
jgi:hypothetical protein